MNNWGDRVGRNGADRLYTVYRRQALVMYSGGNLFRENCPKTLVFRQPVESWQVHEMPVLSRGQRSSYRLASER